MSSPVPGVAPPGPLLPAGNPRIAGIVNITLLAAITREARHA